VKHIYVKFKGQDTEYGYVFSGDLARWHDHFVMAWKRAGHKVRVVNEER
jgi:hypothetical protein